MERTQNKGQCIVQYLKRIQLQRIFISEIPQEEAKHKETSRPTNN